MVALAGLDYYLQAKTRNRGEAPPHAPGTRSLTREERLRLEMDRVLLEAGIAPAWIEEKYSVRLVRVPATVDLDEVYKKMIARALQLGAEVKGSGKSLLPGERELACTISGRAVDTVRLLPAANLSQTPGEIAIVIDDFGYNDDRVTAQFLALPFALTYAIIPGLPHSTAIARNLQQANKAVIVHMPMEALERKVEQDGFELLVASSPDEIRKRVRMAIAAVPGAQGMNNHMGSRATQDAELLNAAFSELKKSGLFFLDSRTTPDTRAFTLAQEQGLVAGLNDTFLDTVEDAAYVRQKLKYLSEVATARGAAIGIGHPYRVTLQVLKEAVPELQQRGFEMVPVEKVLRRQVQQLTATVR